MKENKTYNRHTTNHSKIISNIKLLTILWFILTSSSRVASCFFFSGSSVSSFSYFLLLLLRKGTRSVRENVSRSHSATNGLELLVEGEMNKFRDPSLYKLFGISDHYPFRVLSQVQSQIFGKQVQCTIQNAILVKFQAIKNVILLF